MSVSKYLRIPGCDLSLVCTHPEPIRTKYDIDIEIDPCRRSLVYVQKMSNITPFRVRVTPFCTFKVLMISDSSYWRWIVIPFSFYDSLPSYCTDTSLELSS